jgi:uncharacterized protein
VAVAERSETFFSDGLRLQGTLLVPRGPVGVAVLVSGSGPVDRNSDHARMPLSVMRLVAETLGMSGWASLRFDKRGVGASEGDYWTAGLRDNIEDARAAVRHVRALLGGPVVVIGHSEGAVISADLAQDAALLDGAILLAGMAGTGDTTLRWQARALEPEIPVPVRALLRVMRTSVANQQDKQLARLAASEKDTYRVQLVSKVNARWVREFLAYDAASALARAAVPVLAVTGSKDVQVNPDDLDRMAQLAPDLLTTVLVPDVDHVLRHEPAARSSPRAYKKQVSQPLDPRVVEAVTTWLAGLTVTNG